MSNLYYLAAPYTGTADEVSARMTVFCKADAQLMRDGYLTASPLLKHYVAMHGDLPTDWAYWSEYSEELLSHCKGMIVLTMPGWKKSVGVTAEIQFCVDRGIEVLYFDPYTMEFVVHV